MAQKHFSLLFCVAFCLGVSIAFFQSFWELIFLSFLFLVILFLLKVRFIILFLLLPALIFGFFRFQFSLPKISPDHVSYYWNQTVRFEILVDENPDTFSSFQNIVGKVVFQGKILSGRVSFYVPSYPTFQYGDFLEVEGVLLKPEPSSESYLALHHIYGVFDRNVRVHLVEQEKGNPFFSFLYWFKGIFRAALQDVLPEPHASLAIGLLLGDRTSIPFEYTDAFQKTGLTHILAISGYNITLVIAFVTGLLRFCSRRIQIFLATLFIGIFTLLVGASAAVVRAALMGILGLLASWFGRKQDGMVALFVASFLMVLWNPQTLLFDKGFHLSFAATLGLMLFRPFFEMNVSRFAVVYESMVTTLSASLLVNPLILFYFGRFSLIAPLANLLVAPLVPLAMLFSFSAGIMAFFGESVSLFFGFFARLPLELMLFFVKFLAKIPFASWEVDGF